MLTNPKHTGHMVWNRHARKSGSNRANPVAEWVWSANVVHEPLVSLETFIRVQEISGHRFGSRSGSGPNARHPQTKRSYLLRTYLFCALCGRRMHGTSRRRTAYYMCDPAKGYAPAGHPARGSFFIREDQIIDRLNDFLNRHVFGAYRRSLLAATAEAIDTEALQEHHNTLDALERAIADIEQRIKRIVRNLELVDDPDPELLRDITERRASLRAQRTDLETQLGKARTRVHTAPNPDLLDVLPIGRIDVDQLPAELARQLFEALRLEIHYNRDTNQARCRITLAGPTIAAARRTARLATVPADGAAGPGDGPPEDPRADPPVPILVVPPAGFAPATPSGYLTISATASLPRARSVRAGLAELGVDRVDLATVVDLASVGATLVGWRDGPLEDWHAEPGSRIGDVDLMQASIATTRLVRREMADQPVEVMLRRIQVVLCDLDRRLPDGRTLAEVAPSPLEALRHVEHVAAAVRRWGALSVEFGAEGVVGVLACAAGWRARRWWGTPWWPRRVEAFLDGFDEQDRSALLSDRDVGRAELAAMLLDEPDAMDAGLLRACLRAGLGDVAVAAEPLVGRWFRRFALLAEPDTPVDVYREVLLDLGDGGGVS